MNERIKELYNEVVGDDKLNFDSYLAEKFAELIVKECLDIADGQKKWVEDMEVFNERDANWNRARIQQSQQIIDKIKQHFGVEE